MKVTKYCILFIELTAIVLASGSVAHAVTVYEIDKDYLFLDSYTIKTNDGWTFHIEELKKYNISGKVVGVRYYREDTLPFSPVDLCIGRDKLADPSYEKFINFSMSYRYCNVEYNGPELSTGYIITHSSNNHIIPSNKKVFDKLMSVNKGDFIEISGALVSVRGQHEDGRYTDPWTSSTSNIDSNMGACEIILVKDIEVLEKLPEELSFVERIMNLKLPEELSFLKRIMNVDRATAFVMMLTIMFIFLIILILRRK